MARRRKKKKMRMSLRLVDHRRGCSWMRLNKIEYYGKNGGTAGFSQFR
jgi:hypothetical protein